MLQRNDAAKEAWAAIYEALSEGKPGLLGAITARAEAQVLRLSLIYAAIDGSESIKPPHLMAALAVWEHAEASAASIFGAATGDPLADRIVQAVQIVELTRTKISDLFKHHVSATRISKALDLLVALKKANFRIEETGGRNVEIWFATS